MIRIFLPDIRCYAPAMADAHRGDNDSDNDVDREQRPSRSGAVLLLVHDRQTDGELDDPPDPEQVDGAEQPRQEAGFVEHRAGTRRGSCALVIDLAYVIERRARRSAAARSRSASGLTTANACLNVPSPPSATLKISEDQPGDDQRSRPAPDQDAAELKYALSCRPSIPSARTPHRADSMPIESMKRTC